MSQLEDKRTPTKVDLDAYNKILILSTYSMGVCKPKQRKDKKGNFHDSNKHIPMRYSKIGEYIIKTIIEFGAIILDANSYYVGGNLNKNDRLNNYNNRIELQTKAIARTYEVEHCIRMLHEHRPFAESTINWWIYLLVDARKSMIAWKESDVKIRRTLL